MAARPHVEPGSQTGAAANSETDYWKALGLVRVPPLPPPPTRSLPLCLSPSHPLALSLLLSLSPSIPLSLSPSLLLFLYPSLQRTWGGSSLGTRGSDLLGRAQIDYPGEDDEEDSDATRFCWHLYGS